MCRPPQAGHPAPGKRVYTEQGRHDARGEQPVRHPLPKEGYPGHKCSTATLALFERVGLEE